MKAKLSLIAIASSILLTACGGGGGDSAPVNGNPPTSNNPTPPVAVSPPVDTPPPVVTPASDLQTSVPAPTYAAGSEELVFFNILNDFRGNLGLGLLAQNAKLDAANRNHLGYLMANKDVDFSAVDPATGRPWFHLENPARPSFTGITELDRAKFTQYAGIYVGETGAYGNGKGAGQAITDLIATVYHRAGLMYQFPREVGIAVGTDKYQTMVVTFAYQTKQQKNASNYFGSYPADKQSGVPRVAYIETPNPFPELAYSEFASKTSFPISVMTPTDTVLTTTSFTVTEAGQSVALDARLMTKDTDPNKIVLANMAHLIGKAPFKANTTYNVRYEGSVNGQAIVKAWTFTTAQ